MIMMTTIEWMPLKGKHIKKEREREREKDRPKWENRNKIEK
jgi:hypothetical protein